MFVKSKGTENGGKPLWARKSSWVPHFFRLTCFNGQDSVMATDTQLHVNQMTFKLNWNWIIVTSFRSLNTVYTLAFADAIQCTHKYCEKNKQTCRQQSNHFIYSKTTLSVLFFSIIACNVLMALVFYYNDMLEKIMMQRTQQFSAFPCYRKSPFKWRACTVVHRNLIISNNQVVTSSWNLPKKSSETEWMNYHKNSEFWHRAYRACSEKDLRWITKIPHVKILLL